MVARRRIEESSNIKNQSLNNEKLIFSIEELGPIVKFFSNSMKISDSKRKKDMLIKNKKDTERALIGR
jgi:hypothetical protein